MFPFVPAQSGIVIDWSPKLVSRQRLRGFSAALIFLSYSGLVVPAGCAPASSDYQSDALLLSYGTGKVDREALI